MKDHDWILTASQALADAGWYCAADVVEPHLISAINSLIDQKTHDGGLIDAAIGKGTRRHADESIRRDRIYWLPDHSESDIERSALDLTEDIRKVLNQELFAGLESFEGHVAVYHSGGFYKKHIDTFRDDDARAITFILYLNEAWSERDGGQLRLYTSAEGFIDIAPRAGTVILFRSRDFAHEVLESHCERRTFTGWFKVRARI